MQIYMANQLYKYMTSHENMKLDDENIGQNFSFNDVFYLERINMTSIQFKI